MTKSLTLCGALLALAALASTADASMLGGITSPTSLSRGDTRIPMTSSIGSVRAFSPDRLVSSNGLELRTVGSHWKKPIDSDQGGADDPPKKTPKDPKTTDNSDGSTYPHPYTGQGGWYDHHHHPHSDGTGGDTGGQPPQRTHR